MSLCLYSIKLAVCTRTHTKNDVIGHVEEEMTAGTVSASVSSSLE